MIGWRSRRSEIKKSKRTNKLIKLHIHVYVHVNKHFYYSSINYKQ